MVKAEFTALSRARQAAYLQGLLSAHITLDAATSIEMDEMEVLLPDFLSSLSADAAPAPLPVLAQGAGESEFNPNFAWERLWLNTTADRYYPARVYEGGRLVLNIPHKEDIRLVRELLKRAALAAASTEGGAGPGGVYVPREVLEAATSEARARFPEWATNPDHGRAANGYQQGYLAHFRAATPAPHPVTEAAPQQWVPVGEWVKEHHKNVEVLYKLHKAWVSTLAYWDNMGGFWRRVRTGNKILAEVCYVTPEPRAPAFPPLPAAPQL